MLFKHFTKACEEIQSTSKRLKKIEILTRLFKEAGEKEIGPLTRLLLGKIVEKGETKVGVSGGIIWNTLKKTFEFEKETVVKAKKKAEDFGSLVRAIMEEASLRKKQLELMQEELTVSSVYNQLRKLILLSGQGSRIKKENLLGSMLLRCSPLEAKYMVNILIGDLRIGVYEGLIEQALSSAFKLSEENVRRAHMLSGSLPLVAEKAKKEGRKGVLGLGLTLFKPIKPMLAINVDRIEEVFKIIKGKVIFEFKLDGARVQVHKKNGEVRVFSRRLSDLTQSLKNISNYVKENYEAKSFILEGEVIALDEKGNMASFTDLMRRFRRIREDIKTHKKVTLKLVPFDLLYLNGEALIDTPLLERREKLVDLVGEDAIGSLLTDQVDDAKKYFEESVSLNNEGLMAKNPKSKYMVGVRGKNWLKIKRYKTVDLVIVAGQWGYGRRKGWISDYFLAARNSETNELEIVGKTFKGLTDEEFNWITGKLLSEKLYEREGIVYVKPTIVVEVAFDEVQESNLYPSGVALRFARIKKIRMDKTPEEIDTVNLLKKLIGKRIIKN